MLMRKSARDVADCSVKLVKCSEIVLQIAQFGLLQHKNIML